MFIPRLDTLRGHLTLPSFDRWPLLSLDDWIPSFDFGIPTFEDIRDKALDGVVGAARFATWVFMVYRATSCRTIVREGWAEPVIYWASICFLVAECGGGRLPAFLGLLCLWLALYVYEHRWRKPAPAADGPGVRKPVMQDWIDYVVAEKMEAQRKRQQREEAHHLLLQKQRRLEEERRRVREQEKYAQRVAHARKSPMLETLTAGSAADARNGVRRQKVAFDLNPYTIGRGPSRGATHWRPVDLPTADRAHAQFAGRR